MALAMHFSFAKALFVALLVGVLVVPPTVFEVLPVFEVAPGPRIPCNPRASFAAVLVSVVFHAILYLVHEVCAANFTMVLLDEVCAASEQSQKDSGLVAREAPVAWYNAAVPMVLPLMIACSLDEACIHQTDPAQRMRELGSDVLLLLETLAA